MKRRENVVERCKAVLLDSVRAFGESDLERHVDTALAALNRIKPKLCFTHIRLAAGRSLYPCPDNLRGIQTAFWGRGHKAQTQVWDDAYVGKLPEWSVTRNEAGIRFLRALPAPTVHQINQLGDTAELEYRADWLWEDIDDHLENLICLRALAEAMRELAAKNATTPYNLREGISSVPMNGTPAYLHEQLLAEFERLAAR